MSRHRSVVGIASFESRHEAGRLLAHVLDEAEVVDRSDGRIVVIGLARGGVEVATEVAAALHAPLDALAVRKVGHPWHPEYGNCKQPLVSAR